MEAILNRKVQETEDVYSFLFTPTESLQWKAGQFIYYTIPHEDPDERGTERHFTISSAPFERNVMLTSKFDKKEGSTFKNALLDLKVGDTVDIHSLEGDFTVEDYSKKYVLIAGGIGITPYRSILLDALDKGEEIDAILLYGNKDKDIVFKDELEAAEEEFESTKGSLSINYIIEPEIIDQDNIKKYVADYKERLFFISGPLPMVKGIKETLEEGLGIKKSKIKTDYFPGYEPED